MVYEIDIDCESGARGAAERAAVMLADGYALRAVYAVTGEDGRTVTVDLEDEESGL